jgi:hypothetical protein
MGLIPNQTCEKLLQVCSREEVFLMSVVAFLEQSQSFTSSVADFGLVDRQAVMIAAFDDVLPDDPAAVNAATGQRLFEALQAASGTTEALMRAFLTEFKHRFEVEHNLKMMSKSVVINLDLGNVGSVSGKSLDTKVYIPPAVPPAIFAVLVGAGLYYGTRYIMAHYGPFGPPWWQDIFYEP